METRIRTYLPLLTFLLVWTVSGQNSFGQDYKKVVDLKEEWKFSILGSEKWESADFDDSKWESIKVPSSWEQQGYNGYDGYGYYRKTINIDSELKNQFLYLFLGYVDDVDEVYFNGKQIGRTGGFPPNYETAYNAKRKYLIPIDLINYSGANTLAVKVYDAGQEGGIVGGKIGLYTLENMPPVVIDLNGNWNFIPEDKEQFASERKNGKHWQEVLVPGILENQGFKDFDSIGWYQKYVDFPKELDGETLVLMLGKIDDVDMCYLNGELIGQTGDFSQPNEAIYWRGFDQVQRTYYIKPNQFKAGKGNLIAIRVRDAGGASGIAEGPVYIVRISDFRDYTKKYR